MVAAGDPFAKVIKAIDDLVAKLKLNQADEVKHRDFCIEEFHQNEVDQAEKEHALENLKALIEELTQRREAIAEEIETLNAEIFDLRSNLQGASKDRIKENADFKQTCSWRGRLSKRPTTCSRLSTMARRP